MNTLDTLANWGNLVVLIGQFLVGWFMWSMRQSFVPKKDFTELKDQVAKHDTDLKLHAQTLDGVPTDGDLHKVISEMGEVNRQSSVTAEKVNGISEQLKTLSHQIGRLNDYLLDRGGR